MKSETGSGKLSASRGNGFAGGGGGRVSVNVIRRHDISSFSVQGKFLKSIIHLAVGELAIENVSMG